MTKKEPEKYPIDTLDKARSSLNKVLQNGTSAEKVQVKKAIYEKHASLRPYEGGV